MPLITLPSRQARAQMTSSASVGGALSLAEAQRSAAQQLQATAPERGFFSLAGVQQFKASDAAQRKQAAQVELEKVNRAVSDTTNAILDAHDEYVAKTEQSRKLALSNKAYNRASQQLALEVGAINSEEFDELGNPLYKNMPTRVKQAADKIMSKQASEIGDMDAYADFKIKFQDLVNTSLDKTSFIAREKQSEFEKSQTFETINLTLKQAAEDDPSQIPNYEQRALNSLAEAFNAGIFDEAEFEAAAKGVKETALTVLAENDPVNAAKIIGGNLERTAKELAIPAEQLQEFLGVESLSFKGVDLGMSPQEMEKFRKLLNASVKTNFITSKKIESANEAALQRRQSEIFKVSNLRARAGELTEKELVNLEEELSASQFEQVRQNYNKATEKAREEQAINMQINQSLLQNGSTYQFSKKQIQNHYDTLVQDLAFELGRAPTLTEKAEVASLYSRPISSLDSEIEYSALKGSSEASEDAVRAYLELESAGTPPDVSKATVDFIADVENRVKNLNVPAQIAIQEARDAMEAAKDANLREMAGVFNNMDEFKGTEYMDTAADSLDIDSDQMAPEVGLLFKKIARERFLTTGDEDVAKSAAAKIMNRTHGMSTVNNPDGEYMLHAPEKLLPGITAEQFKEDLNRQARVVKKDAEDLQLISGTFTRGLFTKINGEQIEVPRYLVGKRVVLEDGNTIIAPTLNDNGEPLYYIPDLDFLLAEEDQSELLQRLSEEDAALEGRPVNPDLGPL